MSEGPGQQQRYCTNCGAEIRPGNSFCTSCGTLLTPPTQEDESGSTHPESPPPGPTYSEPTPSAEPNPSDDPPSQPRDSAEDLRRLPGRAWEWFRDLPSVPKLMIVGLGLLVLLIFLSPLGVIVAALVFGVSIIALIIRAFL